MKKQILISIAILLSISGCVDIDSSSNNTQTKDNDNRVIKENHNDNESNRTVLDDTISNPMAVEDTFNPYDKYYYQQWYLDRNDTFYNEVGIDKDANIHSSYSRSKYSGQGIKIAVIDDGLDMYHEDLTDALISSYDIESNTSDVSHRDFFGFHGTAVSSIAVARHNNIGIDGVAHNAQLIFLRYKENMSDSETITLFNKAQELGADIIICSWGTYNVSKSVKDKIISLAKNGRNGLGIPIVFAVGNENIDMGNDESAIDEVISVGASNIHNDRAWYSNYGKHLDILAPGGDYDTAITALDDSGERGTATLNPDYILYNDYYGFAGTSPAAAIVGGAVALMMEANPDLSRKEIEDILKNTADKIGDKPYIDGRNDYYGYGKINLDRAVKEAQKRR